MAWFNCVTAFRTILDDTATRREGEKGLMTSALTTLRAFSASHEDPRLPGLGLTKIGLEMQSDMEFCRGDATPVNGEIFAHT
jgi:hypothetical protein